MSILIYLEELFCNANSKMLSLDDNLFETQISERCLCGRLMLYLNEMIKDSVYSDYYVDVEYNRNNGELKTVFDKKYEIIRSITCDLIIHSRGENVIQDNLLALEMKKSNRLQEEKDKDKKRLMLLTKKSYNDTWSADGKTLPEHVCGYILGIYYEINFITESIMIEYYRNGEKYNSYNISFEVNE